jgi:hypothetical protein
MSLFLDLEAALQKCNTGQFEKVARAWAGSDSS